MSIIKSVASKLSQEDKIVESLIKQANELASKVRVVRLGILEDYQKGEANTTVGKGDLVFVPQEKAVYVATGKYDDEGRPIIMNRHKTRKIEPEFVTVGAMVADPVVKRMAGRLAVEHPNRRVLVWGSLPAKNRIGEATTNVSDQPLPSHDKGIPSTWKGEPHHNCTTKGSTVHNDPDQSETSLKQAGKFKKHKIDDEGNPAPLNDKDKE